MPEEKKMPGEQTIDLQSDEAELRATVGMLDIDRVQAVASYVASKVNSLSTAAVRELWLHNYIELVARLATGSPDRAVLFITQCLDIDRRLEVVEEEQGPEVMHIETHAAMDAVDADTGAGTDADV